MNKLKVAQSNAVKGPAEMPLKGVAAPEGRRTVYDEDGNPVACTTRTTLRGVPVASGMHMTYDSDGEN